MIDVDINIHHMQTEGYKTKMFMKRCRLSSDKHPFHSSFSIPPPIPPDELSTTNPPQPSSGSTSNSDLSKAAQRQCSFQFEKIDELELHAKSRSAVANRQAAVCFEKMVEW
jgi:hypothetical protein